MNPKLIVPEEWKQVQAFIDAVGYMILKRGIDFPGIFCNAGSIVPLEILAILPSGSNCVKFKASEKS